MAKASFQPTQVRYTIDGTIYLLKRASNAYSKWYVLNEAGKYLSKPLNNQLDAQIQAHRIHRGEN